MLANLRHLFRPGRLSASALQFRSATLGTPFAGALAELSWDKRVSSGIAWQNLVKQLTTLTYIVSLGSVNVCHGDSLATRLLGHFVRVEQQGSGFKNAWLIIGGLSFLLHQSSVCRNRVYASFHESFNTVGEPMPYKTPIQKMVLTIPKSWPFVNKYHLGMVDKNTHTK